jgi:voltage-gated potassium channel
MNIFNIKNIGEKLLLIEVFITVFGVGLFPISWQNNLFRLLFITIFFTSVVNVQNQHKNKLIWTAATLFIFEMVTKFLELEILDAILKCLESVFFISIVIILIHQIAKAKIVTSKIILKAINVYLLIGLTFSVLISLIVQFDKNAYNFSNSNTTQKIDFLYYSFSTFATLGYGDLLPLKPYTKSIAILISVSGQIYLAVLLALLVGKYITYSHSVNDNTISKNEEE